MWLIHKVNQHSITSSRATPWEKRGLEGGGIVDIKLITELDEVGKLGILDCSTISMRLVWKVDQLVLI